ncbi:hypothetical protein AFLA_004118 [Aspergillus flavus NRRL3357]|nr:hypothetical protein AFLA_004118 [Aspergillus flavus NRRL3357]
MPPQNLSFSSSSRSCETPSSLVTEFQRVVTRTTFAMSPVKWILVPSSPCKCTLCPLMNVSPTLMSFVPGFDGVSNCCHLLTR